MLTHRLGKPRESDHAAHFPLHDVLDFAQPSEEGGNEIVESLPGGRQPKRPPLEEPRAELFLEPRDLCAYRGLLNAVRNLPACGYDAFASSHVIEQLQMMHVEHIDFFNM